MAGFMVPSSSSGSLDGAPAPTPAPAAPKRRVLGDSTKRTARPAAAATVPALAPSSAAAQTPARPNAQIAVFEDEPVPDVRTAIAGSGGSGPSTNAWPELGTRASRVKENVREVTKMAGATLKQKRGPTARAPSGSGFVVFTGPEEPPALPKTKAKSAARAASGSGFAVFTGPEESHAPPKPKPKAPRKDESMTEAFAPFVGDAEPSSEKFVPFVDEEEDGANTSFVPFCDDDDVCALSLHIRSTKPSYRSLPHERLQDPFPGP
jgi:hypothetical protein